MSMHMCIVRVVLWWVPKCASWGWVPSLLSFLCVSVCGCDHPVGADRRGVGGVGGECVCVCKKRFHC